ncbi:hypothetical protein G9A89_022783 [Geosiphon pyriformis]|nr:hypothetical protein G9A89_022783 [Geosiphon pyriformis]
MQQKCKLSKEHYPDNEKALGKFLRINEAYYVLDDYSRLKYDCSLNIIETLSDRGSCRNAADSSSGYVTKSNLNTGFGRFNFNGKILCRISKMTILFGN